MHGKRGRGNHIISPGNEGEGNILQRIIATGMRDKNDFCHMRKEKVLHTVCGAGMIGKGPEMKNTIFLFIV
jgi:hypothetical protein